MLTVKPAESAHRTHVLVVEDDASSRRIVAGMLANLGCSVDAVPTRSHAVQAAKLKRYQLILMDCQMDDGDGIWATRQIRAAKGPSQQTPIVAITVLDNRADCLAAGMNDYLQKPIQLQDLVRLITRWGSNARAARAAAGGDT
jgi:CheY-like chemotaxis protein